MGDRKISIRTSVLEEKATACNMLCCYADELKDGFYPYVEQVCSGFCNSRTSHAVLLRITSACRGGLDLKKMKQTSHMHGYCAADWFKVWPWHACRYWHA